MKIEKILVFPLKSRVVKVRFLEIYMDACKIIFMEVVERKSSILIRKFDNPERIFLNLSKAWGVEHRWERRLQI